MQPRTQILLIVALAVCRVVAQTSEPEPHSRTSGESCDNEVSLGISSSQGRSSFLDLSSGAKICTENDRRRWAFEGEIVSSSRNGSVILQQSADGNYEFRFARRWFWTFDLSEEANRDVGLESRVIAAPGLGYQISPRWGYFLVEGGFTRTWENDLAASPTSFPEVWGATRVTWRNRKGMSVTESLEFYAKTGDTANHRWFSNTELRFRITDRLSIRSTLRFQWDNVPALHYPKTSITTRTQFAYSFSR